MNFPDGKLPTEFDPITWKDIEWFVKFTRLPVILKGILSPEDAKLAVEVGCKGIIVSNHGARILDTLPSSIEVLPDIVEAVGSQITVMIDGGIRNGMILCTEIYLNVRITKKIIV